jgi:hypothetical protein
MKNIYLLPTDKPSRLFLNKVNNKLLLDSDTYSNLEKILPSSNYQHLYITSNEEIEDCWVLNTHTNEVYFLKYYSNYLIYQKIVTFNLLLLSIILI